MLDQNGPAPGDVTIPKRLDLGRGDGPQSAARYVPFVELAVGHPLPLCRSTDPQKKASATPNRPQSRRAVATKPQTPFPYVEDRPRSASACARSAGLVGAFRIGGENGTVIGTGAVALPHVDQGSRSARIADLFKHRAEALVAKG